MIGVDVIDLKDPLLKARERALRFIVHPDDNYPEHQQAFWFLWAAKEAIFKTSRVKEVFDPKKIAVTIHQSHNSLTFESKNVSGEIQVTPDYVSATAQNNQEANPITVVSEKAGKDPSQEVRKSIIMYFDKEHSISTGIIADPEGLPLLEHNKAPVSFSHHGRYICFAYFAC